MMAAAIAKPFPIRRSQRQMLLLESVASAWKVGKVLAALPFDAMRFGYASAVKAGIVQNSMLKSRDFERALGAFERMTLGPLARRV